MCDKEKRNARVLPERKNFARETREKTRKKKFARE